MYQHRQVAIGCLVFSGSGKVIVNLTLIVSQIKTVYMFSCLEIFDADTE